MKIKTKSKNKLLTTLLALSIIFILTTTCILTVSASGNEAIENNNPSFTTNNEYAQPSSLTKNNNLYSLNSPTLAHGYGEIPEEYQNTDIYPFVIFDSNGFVAALTGWYTTSSSTGVVDLLHTLSDKYTVLLRRDYIYDNPTSYDNHATDKHSGVTVDLGGYKLTQNGTHSKGMLYANTKANSDIYFTFKNGTIEIRDNSFITHGAAKEATGTYYFSFENVRIELCGKAPFTSVYSTPAYSARSVIGFTDCTFDFKNADSEFTSLINLKLKSNDTNKIISTVSFVGGEFVADDFANVKIIGTVTKDTEIIFKKNASGEYTTAKVTENGLVPNETFNTNEGVLYFGSSTASESGFTVRLRTLNLSTPYGDITPAYGDVERYPFAIFDTNGKFIKAASNFYGNNASSSALGLVRAYLKANEWNTDNMTYGDNEISATVFMRRDYSISNNEVFYNLSHLQGTVTINLGGHTLAQNSKALFHANIKGYADSGDAETFPTNLIVKNGSILIKDNTVVLFSVYDTVTAQPGGNGVADKMFTIEFIEVNFTYADGSSVTNPLIDYSDDKNTPGAIGNGSVTFKDCIFDFGTNLPKESITIFNANAKAKGVEGSYRIIVEGGSIILGRDTTYALTAVSNGSEVSFFPNIGGSLITLVLPINSTAPREIYTIAGIEYSFTKISSTDSYDYYELTEYTQSMVEFTPAMSITLDKEFVINIYVPANNSLQRFAFDGTTYRISDFSSLETVTRDGEEFYLFKVSMPASGAAKIINLTATLMTSVGYDVKSYSFSIPAYAERIINANSSKPETRLVCDVLSYIRAAYDYFKTDSDGESIAKINELLGEDYDEANHPTVSGEINKVGPITAVTLVLDARPSIRFYTEESSLEFFIGQNAVATRSGSDGYGKYVELDVYAYMLAETVTFENGGSYHISDFLEGSIGTRHENLVARFIRYAESASRYKNAITDKPDNEIYSSMQSVLLLGQSNMAGRGDINTVDPIVDERIFMLRNNAWVTMSEPIHNDKLSAGVGLAASFAKAFVETFDCDLGLIPGAFGGTSLEDWQVGGYYYNRALEMALAAKESSEICAILWHQGESDQSNTTYAEELKIILDSFIRDLGLDETKIVIVTGELGEFRKSSRDNVHNGLMELNNYYEKYGIASASGLTALDVTTHFDAPSLRVFGYRYFDIFYSRVTGKNYVFDDNPASYRIEAELDETIVTSNNFDSLPTGDLSSGGAFSFALKSGTISIEELDLNSKYLSIKSGYDSANGYYTDTYCNIATKPESGKKIAIEAKFKLGEAHSSNVDIFKIIGASTISTLRVDGNGKLYNKVGGDSSVNENLAGTLDTLEWTTIKLVIDLENNTKEIYVSGTLVYTGALSVNELDSFSITSVRLVQFINKASKSGEMLVDDYKCYYV